MSPSKRRWLDALLRLAPIVFLVLFYRDALRTWFQQDDFAWLLLRQSLNTPADWFWGLITPFAQGTVRPISERLFFIWGREFFFLDPRPMHLVVALTQTANLLLLFSLAMRLLRNPWVASLACFTWLTGIGLATPMSWLSTYNQVLISLVFLGGLRAFIAAADSGRRRWLVLAWLSFLFGFGVLELNVVFPALLTAWVLLYKPRTVETDNPVLDCQRAVRRGTHPLDLQTGHGRLCSPLGPVNRPNLSALLGSRPGGRPHPWWLELAGANLDLAGLAHGGRRWWRSLSATAMSPNPKRHCLGPSGFPPSSARFSRCGTIFRSTTSPPRHPDSRCCWQRRRCCSGALAGLAAQALRSSWSPTSA